MEEIPSDLKHTHGEECELCKKLNNVAIDFLESLTGKVSCLQLFSIAGIFAARAIMDTSKEEHWSDNILALLVSITETIDSGRSPNYADQDADQDPDADQSPPIRHLH